MLYLFDMKECFCWHPVDSSLPSNVISNAVSAVGQFVDTFKGMGVILSEDIDARSLGGLP